MPIPQSLRDQLWLLEHREGHLEMVEIARRDHVPVRAIFEGIARAENVEIARLDAPIPVVAAPPEPDPHEGEPVVVPMFPITSLVPSSTCPHWGTVNDGIRRGSRMYCVICDRCGLDHLALLQRPPMAKTNKKYDGGQGKSQGKAKEKDKGKPKGLTRKERRDRFFRGIEPDAATQQAG